MTTTGRAEEPLQGTRRSPIATAMRWTSGLALTVAVVGVLILSLGTFTGWLSIQSVPTGSMEPTIAEGSIIVVDPIDVDDVGVGEVIVFAAPETGVMTVHRVVSVEQTESGPVFTTKGDANDSPDPWRLAVEGDTLHQVRMSVPWVGQALIALSAPWTRLLLMALGIVLVLGFGMAHIWRDEPEADEVEAAATWDSALSRVTGGHAHLPRPHLPHDAAEHDAEPTAEPTEGQPGPEDPAVAPTSVPETETETGRRRPRLATTGPAIVLVGVLLAGAVAWLPIGRADAAYAATTAANGTAASLTVPPKTATSCAWTSTTALSVAWTNPNPTDSAEVLMATTSGGATSVVATAAAGTTNAPYSPSPVTTVRYLSTRAVDGTWTSVPSTEMATNTCRGSINAYAGSGTRAFSGDGGAATSAALNAPVQTALAPDGRLFIADSGNNRIRVVSTAGVISTFAGGTGGASACTFSGPVASLRMNAPRGVAVDSVGNVYIADSGANCIRRVDTSGNVTRFAGGGGTTTCNTTTAPTNLSLSAPTGLAVDSTDALVVADTGRACVRRLTSATTTRVAGGGGTTTCVTTTAANVSLSNPQGVAVDAADNVYIADTGRNCVRKVVGTAVTTVIGGGGTTACTAATTATSISLSGPQGVVVDSSGTVYVADSGRRCVRKVVGTAATQVAFTGTNSSVGDNGPAIGATARTPSMLTVLGDGDLLVSDRATNTTSNVVRRIELS